MDINPHIFREFSIRGIADRDLTDDVVTRLGQAVGTFYRERGLKTLVVGRDVRLSSDRINRALAAGLRETGVHLIDIGTVPTPVLNFSADILEADGGIMITASHNPPDYNGLKLRTGETLHGDELQQIYQLAQSEQDLSHDGGSYKEIDPFPVYVKHLKDQAVTAARPLRIVVDGGNGTNGLIVAALLTDLGHEAIELYCNADGRFPNRNPDPTAPGALKDLSAQVSAVQADVGIAFDGDGDRMVAVDNQGTIILGDQLLMLLSREALRGGPAGIVYEILCTQAVADDVRAHGGTAHMTPSGYAFVHRAMQETGAVVGGELSGHFFFRTPHFRFDDAILATIKLLSALTIQRRTLSDLIQDLPAYHSSPELRLQCPDAAKTEIVDRVRERYRGEYQVEEIDGARIHFLKGWALVRQSNTQPVISMRFEARTAEDLKTIQDEVQVLVESFIREAQSRSHDKE